MCLRDARRGYRPEQETPLIYTEDSLITGGGGTAKVASETREACKVRAEEPRTSRYIRIRGLYSGW